MALTPIKGDWGNQVEAGGTDTFIIESEALRTTTFVINPVFRFYNFGTESFSLVITHVLDLGSRTDDPVHSGTYSINVVDVIVTSGGFYAYDFGGIQLDSNTDLHVTHTVTIQNLGSSTRTYHALLYGSTEVQTQIGAGSIVTWTA
jgi:hypothetical protein